MPGHHFKGSCACSSALATPAWISLADQAWLPWISLCGMRLLSSGALCFYYLRRQVLEHGEKNSPLQNAKCEMSANYVATIAS
jgi:hypothetical protein